MIIQYFSGNAFRLIKSALSLLQVLDDLTEVEQLQRHLIERSHFPYLSHTAVLFALSRKTERGLHITHKNSLTTTIHTKRREKFSFSLLTKIHILYGRLKEERYC